MEIHEFNAFGLKEGDVVRVVLNDGTTSTETIMRGNAYAGNPEKLSYSGGRIPATPPSIVVQDKHTGGEKGIALIAIRTVSKLTSI